MEIVGLTEKKKKNDLKAMATKGKLLLVNKNRIPIRNCHNYSWEDNAERKTQKDRIDKEAEEEEQLVFLNKKELEFP